MLLDANSITPKSEQPPKGLLVILHGWGANGKDVEALAAYLNLENYHLIFPDAPFPYAYTLEGRQWYDLSSPTYEGLEDSRIILRQWLESLEGETGIPLERTVLAGFSQGGAMTLDVGFTLPIAGLCSLSGYLHYQPQDIGKNPPPTLIVHGKQDQVVPITAAHQARDALTALGANIEYHELEMGHEIPTPDQMSPSPIELMEKFVKSLLS